jgi:hypothetical protein
MPLNGAAGTKTSAAQRGHEAFAVTTAGESKGFRGFMLAIDHDEVLFRSAQLPEVSLCLCTV